MKSSIFFSYIDFFLHNFLSSVCCLLLLHTYLQMPPWNIDYVRNFLSCTIFCTPLLGITGKKEDFYIEEDTEESLYPFFPQMLRQDSLGNSLAVSSLDLSNIKPHCLPELCWKTACAQHLWILIHKYESVAWGKTGSRVAFCSI